MVSHNKVRMVKEMIRSPYAWPGGYAKVLLMEDGESLCVECARSEFREIASAFPRSGWTPEAVYINWEDESLTCAHCGKHIRSEYGEDADKEDAV